MKKNFNKKSNTTYLRKGTTSKVADNVAKLDADMDFY